MATKGARKELTFTIVFLNVFICFRCKFKIVALQAIIVNFAGTPFAKPDSKRLTKQ